MSTFTVLKRHYIYREAYRIFKQVSTPMLCPCIAHAAYGNAMLYPNVTREKFPELFMFQPDFNEYKAFWLDPADKETRLIILSFCIAMTQP